MTFLFKGIFYLAILYLLWGGLMVLLSVFYPVHKINKKYWGFVLFGIAGATMGIFAYINDNYILVLIALVLGFILPKIFGGAPDLNPSKITIDNRKNLDNLYEEGIDLGKSGKYLEAIKIFDDVLKIDPKHIDALASKAYSLCLLHKYEEAIMACEEALKINPKHELALCNLDEVGACLGESGKYLEAIDVFNKILEIDPTNVHALANKANALIYLHKDEDAITMCNKALAYAPQDIEALNKKAAALTNLNKFQEAMEIFDKVLKMNPKNLEAIKNKGRCHYRCYEKLGILHEMPEYTWEEISRISVDNLMKEINIILARNNNSKAW